MTKEYSTVSSMLLMLRWRISKSSFSSKVIIFTTWPGTRFDSVRKSTFEPEILASTSAIGELQHAPSSFTIFSESCDELLVIMGGDGLNCSSDLGLGVGLGLKLFLFFLASRECRTRCNSLMNSMAPPIIDAWSP